ncbi:MAG: beta-lactamase family protein [Verrucomicrobiae bacterium]|nr:beta-lactamase family protein [Verrucomicrobiae bacterium]
MNFTSLRRFAGSLGSGFPVALVLGLATLLLPLLASAAEAGSIQIAWHQGHPRLRWNNTTGSAFQLWSSPELAGSQESHAVFITSDAREVRWVDESPDPAQRFYRWQTANEAPAANQWQAALNQIRTTAVVAGATAAIITSNGVWVGTSGYADRVARTQTEPQMRFCVGGISKSFAAATLLQLAEEGRLSLDDPLKKWLPDFLHVPNTITLRQVLDHTSGIYDYFDSADWEQRMLARPGDPLTLEELFAYVGDPYFSPGIAFHYSSTGYLLLGLVIEKVTGHRVMEEYRQRFIKPLGLSSIYMRQAEPATGDSPHPYSYFNPSGTEKDISSTPDAAYFSCIGAAGGLFSSVEDIARWTHALWSGSLLSPRSYREMIAWNPVGGDEKYGFAVWSQDTDRGEFYVHSGHVPGYRVFAGYSPTLNATVVLAFNSDHFILESWLRLVSEL